MVGGDARGAIFSNVGHFQQFFNSLVHSCDKSPMSLGELSGVKTLFDQPKCVNDRWHLENQNTPRLHSPSDTGRSLGLSSFSGHAYISSE